MCYLIKTGDHVKHGPTGETWIVAFVEDNWLHWCGWPEGCANLNDCELIKSASESERLKLLEQMAKMPLRNDPRKRYALRILDI